MEGGQPRRSAEWGSGTGGTRCSTLAGGTPAPLMEEFAEGGDDVVLLGGRHAGVEGEGDTTAPLRSHAGLLSSAARCATGGHSREPLDWHVHAFRDGREAPGMSWINAATCCRSSSKSSPTSLRSPPG